MQTGRDPIALLPWSQPFRMVDRMVACVPHRSVVTLRNVAADDSLLDGAASGHGLMPSVMLLEGLNQSAALLFRLSYGDEAEAGMPMLGHLTASIRGSAGPGDVLEFTVTAVKMTRRGGIFSGSARVNGSVVAEAEMGFGVRTP